MPIEFRCSQCNQLLRVPEASAGKNARCPKCQTLMTVPGAAQAAPPPPPVPPESSFAWPPGAGPAPAATPAPSTPPEPKNPFSSVNLPAGGVPPPKPANPFGERQAGSPFGGPATGSLNPYASPAASVSGATYAPNLYERTGLPWEIEKWSIGCWFRTFAIILGSPTRAFSIMKHSGNLGTPLTYLLFGVGLPIAALALIALAIGILVVIAIAISSQGKTEVVLGTVMVALAFAGIAAMYIAMIVVSVIVSSFLSSAIYHVALMICGGARQSYETTYRVTAFSAGSVSWIQFIPYVGLVAMMIWLIVLLIIGLSRAHEIPASKSALAILGLYACCCGGAVALVITLGVIGALSGH